MPFARVWVGRAPRYNCSTCSVRTGWSGAYNTNILKSPSDHQLGWSRAYSTNILRSRSSHQLGWSRTISTNILKSLAGRGMVKDVFPREHVSELVDKLESAKRGVYAGFDPTGMENLLVPEVLVYFAQGREFLSFS